MKTSGRLRFSTPTERGVSFYKNVLINPLRNQIIHVSTLASRGRQLKPKLAKPTSTRVCKSCVNLSLDMLWNNDKCTLLARRSLMLMRRNGGNVRWNLSAWIHTKHSLSVSLCIFLMSMYSLDHRLHENIKGSVSWRWYNVGDGLWKKTPVCDLFSFSRFYDKRFSCGFGGSDEWTRVMWRPHV